mmetsp:Transcript_2265/g.3478  ORF Transcript_2265/g.3478 Transcript_2265/m.3478 type:complete len:179 (-) Transcript_2265:348-884(-)
MGKEEEEQAVAATAGEETGVGKEKEAVVVGGAARQGRWYPGPIVDEQRSARAAKDRYAAIRKLESTREMAREVFAKHGSRGRRGKAEDGAAVAAVREKGGRRGKKQGRPPAAAAGAPAKRGQASVASFFGNGARAAGEAPTSTVICPGRATAATDKHSLVGPKKKNCSWRSAGRKSDE